MNHKKIYFISGDSDFLIERRVEGLRKDILGNEINSLNYEKIKGDIVNLDQIIIAINAVPMLTGKKIVLVQDFCLFDSKEKADSLIEKIIIENLKNIIPQNYIIFSCIGNYHKNKFVKELLKIADVEEYNNFSVWDENGVIEWIVKEVNNKGYKINKDIAVLIKDATDNDLRSIDKEITKIITYVGSTNNNITKEDVLEAISTNSINSFKLMNSIRECKFNDASYLIFKMLKEGEEPVRLLFYIISQLRFLFLLKMNDKLPVKEISNNMAKFNMSKNVYYLRKCLSNASKISIDKLKLSYKLAQETDFNIKTGQMEPRVALENFVNQVFVRS